MTLERILTFLSIAGNLKRIKRSGWLKRKIESPESVGDHTFRLCLFALVLCQQQAQDLDRRKCLEMALVHDLAESIVGDIAPHHGVSQHAKFEAEKSAMMQLCEILEDNAILDLWLEYEAGTTEEARLVRDLDVLETALQAVEYAQLGADRSVAKEFLESARRKVQTDMGRELLNQLKIG